MAVTIDKSGQVFLQNTAKSTSTHWCRSSKPSRRNGYDQRIYVRADKGVPYGKVARSDGACCRRQGFTRIGLVNDTEHKPAQGRNGDMRARHRRFCSAASGIIGATLVAWSHTRDASDEPSQVIPVEMVDIADVTNIRPETREEPKPDDQP